MIFSDHNASIFERKSIKVFMGELKFLKKKKTIVVERQKMKTESTV